MFIAIKDIVRILNEMAPPRLAEDWDNVGLQVGHNDKEVKIILCALDFSAEVLEQAVQLHGYRRNPPSGDFPRRETAYRPGLAYGAAAGSGPA